MKKTNISLGRWHNTAFFVLFAMVLQTVQNPCKCENGYMLDISIYCQQVFWLITLLITFLFK